MLQRKASQTKLIYDLLSDGYAHRTDEIVSKIYSGGSLARVGARIWDIQKKFNVKIEGWHDHDNPKLYWYQIKLPEVPLTEMPEYEMYNSGQGKLI
jgi:hypothetical protein